MRLIHRVAFVAVCLILAYGFSSLRFHYNASFDGASLERLTEGTAQIPYQFRALIPWIADLTVRLPFIGLQLDTVYFTIETIGVLLAILSFRKYLTLIFENDAVSSLLSLTLMYPLTIQFVVWDAYPIFFYPYDIPSILFTTLGLVFLYEKNWAKYYVLFAVATLNRETSCFLTIAYLITSLGRETPKRLAFHTLCQFAIWITLKILLYQAFSANGSASNSVSGFFDNNVHLNLQRLQFSVTYLSLLSIVGFLWLPTVLASRMIKNEFVRRTQIICLPFLAGMMVVGNIVEVRIYGELIPIVLSGFLLLCAEFLQRIADRRPRAPDSTGLVSVH